MENGRPKSSLAHHHPAGERSPYRCIANGSSISGKHPSCRQHLRFFSKETRHDRHEHLKEQAGYIPFILVDSIGVLIEADNNSYIAE